jgi:tetrahydrodipicolinate N-succinyltransferase
LNKVAVDGITVGDRSVVAASVTQGENAMAGNKPRPDHVPEENVYNGVHWMVLVTYLAAIGGVAALLVNAG